MTNTRLQFVMLPPQDETTRRWATTLMRDLPEYEVTLAESDAEALDALSRAEAAYGTPTLEMLQAATGLRWLQAPAAAPPAGYYSDYLVQHPVVVTNLRGIYNDHVATHAVAMVLALARGFQRYLPHQADGRWEPDRSADVVVHLPEAEVLIVGLGGIGSQIARLLRPFGCRLTATDARLTEPPEWVDELRTPDALDDLLATADFVVLTVPHTPETEGLIDTEQFQLMKSSSFLVNVGRGMTVRLDPLLAALEANSIAGAALDVFEIEPLPQAHPLWKAANVILTPHVAVAGPYVEERRFGVLVENARRFAKGEPLLNVVDKRAWY